MKKIGNAFALRWLIIVSQVTYSLANAQGLKIMDNTGGKPWNLPEYLHVHGYTPQRQRSSVSGDHDHKLDITFQSKFLCVNLQQHCKSTFNDTLTTTHQKEDHQKTIPNDDDVIDTSQ